MPKVVGLVVAASVVGVGSGGSLAQSIQGLGFVGKSDFTHAAALSADGRVVVGSSSPGPFLPITPVRWVLGSGGAVIEVLERPEGWITGRAVATSGDGSRVVVQNYDGSSRTYQWEDEGGATMFALLPEWRTARGQAVTPDGGYVYGSASLEVGGGRVARWDAAGVPEALELPTGAVGAGSPLFDAGGAMYFVASYSSMDHRVLTENGDELFTMPVYSGLGGVSADGSTFFGAGPTTQQTQRMWAWDAEHGLTFFFESEGSFASTTGVTADGAAVFGYAYDEQGSEGMFFVWSRDKGVRDATEFFVERGVDLGGWTDLSVEDVSSDGRLYVGAGVNPDGRTEAFIIDLGEACRADFNGDGSANSQDYFDFLTAFFANDADFNRDGVTNSQDFFDFLAVFFVGCP